MPLNSTQRPIFVYLRSKNDHKSCTPAGAKLTNEYTHRTNKNNPCIISVTPSQLCTFFRKRTIPTWIFLILHVRNENSPRGRELFLPKFHLIPPKFHFSPTWRIFFLHVGIFYFLRGYLSDVCAEWRSCLRILFLSCARWCMVGYFLPIGVDWVLLHWS